MSSGPGFGEADVGLGATGHDPAAAFVGWAGRWVRDLLSGR
jgi:hypothetical protein